MKFYRPIIRDTRYVEEYRTFDRLFKTKESLELWFNEWKDKYEEEQSHLGDRYQDRFSYVIIGIEEVNIK